MNDKDTKSEDFRGLPPSLAEFGRHMGSADGARRLADKFGGRRISVPLKARPNQVIAEACGIEVARALSELRGGESIYIPLNPDRTKRKHIANKIMKALRKGRDISNNSVAEIVGCSDRYVRQVRAELIDGAKKVTK